MIVGNTLQSGGPLAKYNSRIHRLNTSRSNADAFFIEHYRNKTGNDIYGTLIVIVGPSNEISEITVSLPSGRFYNGAYDEINRINGFSADEFSPTATQNVRTFDKSFAIYGSPNVIWVLSYVCVQNSDF